MKKIIHLCTLIATFILISLSNSAHSQTGAQIGMADQQKRVEGAAAIKKLNERSLQRCADPEFAAYYEKAPCQPTKVTSEQLEDREKITSKEKIVLSKVRQIITTSFQERMRIFRDYGGDKEIRAAEYLEAYVKPRLDKIDLNLYEGKITWGQYNSERNAIALDANIELKKIYQ
jgi:hypothetical protein